MKFASVVLIAAAQIALVRGPNGIMQPVGAAETDSFVLANGGADSAFVSLVPSGGFFTISPSGFTLGPGASQTVTIQATNSAPGFQNGQVGVVVAPSLTPSLNVPVRMFSGTQPAGVVAPQAQDSVLVTSGLAGTQHPGSWNITNGGNVTMQGMLTPDVPWIVPQTDIVNIAPQRNGQFPFLSDPSLRDTVTPLGAIVTNIGMLYLKGTAPSVEQSGEVGATVVDISKVSVVPAQPPDPAPGETIAFLPLVSDLGGFFSDIFFANRGASALTSDLKLFYTAVGAPSSSAVLANAGPLAAGIAAWFPMSPSSLFNVAGQTGTIQMRTGDASKVALSMLRGIVPDGVNRYLTAMPVLRSNTAIGGGDRLVFAGVEKSATAHTDLLVQETAGFSGSYNVDFFDASGAQLQPSKSGNVLPFASISLSDAAPSGARSARLTNTSSGGARLTGFASVFDSTTFDEWTVVDSSRAPGPTSDLVLPVPGGPASSHFDAWITNASASPAVVTIGPSATIAKPHAVRGKATPAPPQGQTITLAARETRSVSLTNTPFVHISGPAGAISASGRFTTTASGRAGSFGTGVPAVAASRASGAGGAVHHFFRANDLPGVSPATLVLIETANRPATVRVTVAFSFPAGASVSAHVEEQKDYDVPAGQLLSVADVIRSVIGSSRDSFGNLVNVVIDVQVVTGEGKVLAYLESVDTSGDLTFSTD